jgi:hypothetical protein
MTGSGDADDDAWRRWTAGRDPTAGRPSLARQVAMVTAALVVAVVFALINRPGAGQRTLGDEVELDVTFIGDGERPIGGDPRVGVTPLTVRRGSPADLDGRQWSVTGGQQPTGTPHYVEVRLTHKGGAPFESPVFLGALDAEGESIPLATPASTAAPRERFTRCDAPEEEISAEESVTYCLIYLVPDGARLARLTAGGWTNAAPVSWRVR